MTASFVAPTQEPTWIGRFDRSLVRLAQLAEDLSLFADDPEYAASLHAEYQQISHHYR